MRGSGFSKFPFSFAVLLLRTLIPLISSSLLLPSDASRLPPHLTCLRLDSVLKSIVPGWRTRTPRAHARRLRVMRFLRGANPSNKNSSANSRKVHDKGPSRGFPPCSGTRYDVLASGFAPTSKDKRDEDDVDDTARKRKTLYTGRKQREKMIPDSFSYIPFSWKEE